MHECSADVPVFLSFWHRRTVDIHCQRTRLVGEHKANSILAMYAPKSIGDVQARIKELREELGRDARYRELNILLETEDKLSALRGINGTGQQIGGLIRRRPAVPQARKGKQPRGKVAQHEAAQAAVEAAGHPITTAELISKIPEFGGDIQPGVNAARNLTSVLSARSSLRSVRWRAGRAWWLKNREVPPE